MTTSRKSYALRGLRLLLVLAFVFSTVPAMAQSGTNCSAQYTVVAGDTLYGIAANYNVVMEDLARANNLTAPYVLTIGDVLCIPSGTSSGATGTSTPASTSKDPTIVVTRTKTGLTVSLTNYNPRNIYYVRAGHLGLKTHEWTRLGLLYVNKDGVGSATFTLPENLRESNLLHVCLKNARTNGLVCVLSRTPNPDFE
jgi:murein DD-endopeptidase MepM/ murein hydrolase activator NlpD